MMAQRLLNLLAQRQVICELNQKVFGIWIIIQRTLISIHVDEGIMAVQNKFEHIWKIFSLWCRTLLLRLWIKVSWFSRKLFNDSESKKIDIVEIVYIIHARLLRFELAIAKIERISKLKDVIFILKRSDLSFDQNI